MLAALAGWCAGRGRPNLRERETGPAPEVLGERPPSATVAAAVSRRKMLHPAVNGMESRLPAPGAARSNRGAARDFCYIWAMLDDPVHLRLKPKPAGD